MFHRRKVMVGLFSAGGLFAPASLTAKPAEGSGLANVGTDREARSVVEFARELGFSGPVAASASQRVSPLDLAELVDRALDHPTNDEIEGLARRTGLILSELARNAKDGRDRDVAGPAGAAAYELTASLAREYASLLRSARIRSNTRPELRRAAAFITSDSRKKRYLEVQEDTKVPWYVVGALHYREASLNFMGHLHNGDPLLLRTVQVPRNRPPKPWPPSDVSDLRTLWRMSAGDALKDYKSISRWSVEAMCFTFEKYNGFGYRTRGLRTPYLWNYTDHYISGGFPRDHVYDPRYVSKQAGLVAILLTIKEMDSSVRFEFES